MIIAETLRGGCRTCEYPKRKKSTKSTVENLTIDNGVHRYLITPSTISIVTSIVTIIECAVLCLK